MSKVICPPATIRIPENCIIIDEDLVALEPDRVIGVVNKMNPELMDIYAPMTIIEDENMTEDANTMRPDAEFTSVTNAKTTDRPALKLSGPDPRPDSDYDPEELKKGMEEESEHSDDPDVQKFIVKTHMDKDPEYYSEG